MNKKNSKSGTFPSRLKFWLIASFLLFIVLIFVFSSFFSENLLRSEYGRFISLSVKSQHFLVEVADDPEKHRLGLMHREQLDSDKGMLFLFPDEDIRNFWMKDTLIPLDIIFINSDKKIVNIRKNAQPCLSASTHCPFYSSHVPAQYVLELNEGQAEKYQIQIGDKVYF